MVINTLVVTYLIVTLGATGLAKLVNRHTARIVIASEIGISPKLASFVVAGIVVVETGLSTLLMLRLVTSIVLGATAVLFLGFAAHHGYVAATTRVPSCACAGKLETKRGSAAAVAGTVMSCLLVAAMAIEAGRVTESTSRVSVLVYIAAWAAPVLAAVVGVASGAARRRRVLESRLRSQPVVNMFL